MTTNSGNSESVTFTNNLVSTPDTLKAEGDYIKAALTSTFGAVSAITKLKVSTSKVRAVLVNLRDNDPAKLGSFTDVVDRWDAYFTARDAARKQRGGRSVQDGTVGRANLAALFGAEVPAE
jgi:hypothetical protein